MKLKTKEIVALLLALTMLIPMQTVANAATIKLSKKSVTITEGSSKTITIKNIKSKNIKSVKLKSSKNKVATVKKKSKTKFSIKAKKTGNAKITVTIKYKKKSKTISKKLILKVKVKEPEDDIKMERVDDRNASAVMKATDATLLPGTQDGISQKPVLDSKHNFIEDIVTNASATYKVPMGVSGNFDIYLEIGRTSYVAGESMYSVTINDKDHYCIPQAITTGSKYLMGRFVMAQNIALKSGDTVKVIGNIGFTKKMSYGLKSNLPAIGNMSLYKAGSKVAQGYDKGILKNESTDPTDPISGKTIVWLGSSVTYGYGSNGYSMADAIRDNHKNTTCYKYAISGTTLVNEDGTSYVARMKNDINPNTKIDMFIVQLSTNDASTSKPLGTFTDEINLDDKTVTGAIETIITYVKNTWNCPVVFYTGTKYDSKNYENMVYRLRKIAEKHNIAIIDLWGDEKMSAIVGTPLYNTYMKDQIHPKKEGYVKWWTPKFEEYLNNYWTVK